MIQKYLDICQKSWKCSLNIGEYYMKILAQTFWREKLRGKKVERDALLFI
jgi:hypothetical protein